MNRFKQILVILEDMLACASLFAALWLLLFIAHAVG